MSPVAWAGRKAKKMLILIIGSAVLFAGILMLALPGPGIIVILIGLLILSQEFMWAERLLDHAVERAAAANLRAQGSARGKALIAASAVGLIAAGIGVIVFFSEYFFVGATLILSGIVGLCTLHPRLHDWVDERARVGINATDDV